MSDVSLETYWAINKHLNNKFYYTVASCWLFLYESINIKKKTWWYIDCCGLKGSIYENKNSFFFTKCTYVFRIIFTKDGNYFAIKYSRPWRKHWIKIEIRSLIFQLNVHYIMEYMYFLTTLFYVFRCVLHHHQGELHITC